MAIRTDAYFGVTDRCPGFTEEKEKVKIVESDSLSFSDLLGLLKRRASVFSNTFVALISLTVLIAFGLPSSYDSTGTILIEQQDIPDDLVQSTITSYADERIQVISQRVMSTDNLASLVQEYGLYGYGTDEENVVAKVRRMQEAIVIEPISAEVINPRSGRPSQATIAFAVTYRNESARLARDVATELTDSFMQENRRSRAEQTQETVSFLESQAIASQSEIRRIETEIADFKSSYQGMLPENVDFNLQSLEREERNLIDIRNQVRIQEERIRFLNDERRALVDAAGGAVDRMAELQEEYAMASSRYAPNHPDVQRLRREIESLRQVDSATQDSDTAQAIVQVRQELAIARDRYSPDHPDIRSLERTLAALESQSQSESAAIPMTASPAVRQIDSEIRERSASLAGLRQSQNEIERNIAQMESQLNSVPEIERQYNMLNRRHEDAVQRHDGIQAKLATARMASQLETEQLGERFTLIDSPRLPDQPASPNRIGILALGVVLAGALSIAALALAEVTDSSVRSARDVEQLLGIPPLAAIPAVETRSDRRKKVFRRVANATFAGLMIGGAAVGVAVLG
jgi:uncharacterized protein involved in exopolysaccharide biosynthesis